MLLECQWDNNNKGSPTLSQCWFGHIFRLNIFGLLLVLLAIIRKMRTNDFCIKITTFIKNVFAKWWEFHTNWFLSIWTLYPFGGCITLVALLLIILCVIGMSIAANPPHFPFMRSEGLNVCMWKWTSVDRFQSTAKYTSPNVWCTKSDAATINYK